MTAALPPTSIDALREEVTRLAGLLGRYVGHEPTIAEELAYRGSEMDRLEAERDRARSIAVHLEQENARLTAIVGDLMVNRLEVDHLTTWTSDLDAMAGTLAITDLPDDRTQVTYRWRADLLDGAE